MSLSNYTLSKTWESAEDFPTFEEDEAQVRADMQCLFDELLDCLNNLVGILNSRSVGTSGAKNIAIADISGLTGATNVQDALALLKNAVDAATTGTLPDHSVVNDKLSRKTDTQGAAVDTENLVAGAVGENELADGAVTGAKTDFSGGLTVGDLTTDDAALGGKIYLSSDSYGETLPATAEAGRLFFQKVTE